MVSLPGLENKLYWEVLEKWARKNSDGCSDVPDYYVESCWEHDWHYRYAVTLYGGPITFNEANSRFRQSIQMRSKLHRFSPLSWIRYVGVRIFGKLVWNKHRERNLPAPVMILR